jgi:acyl-CoA reductase-like NAD-dependent aldehyde dehydrogenase
MLGLENMEGKEKITLSEKDHEAMGYAFLKSGEKELAKMQFSAAHWTEEDIQKALASVKESGKEPKMNPEEKKDLFEKMAEEFEQHAKNAEGKEWGKKYEELARTYRRELDRMGEDKK